MQATLGRGAYRVLEATNGAAGLELARRERPDLVILDVGMPDLDGYTVCRALKGDPETAGMAVVMLTARAQEGDRQRGVEAGADAYITKPFSPRALLETVERMLGS
ncbi:MAG: response regulator [Chloroflexi bacterium]|nr:response regulator [Chloroflexota bacterium]